MDALGSNVAPSSLLNQTPHLEISLGNLPLLAQQMTPQSTVPPSLSQPPQTRREPPISLGPRETAITVHNCLLSLHHLFILPITRHSQCLGQCHVLHHIPLLCNLHHWSMSSFLKANSQMLRRILRSLKTSAKSWRTHPESGRPTVISCVTWSLNFRASFRQRTNEKALM